MTREEILARKPQVKAVHLPAWDKTIHLRKMNAKELAAIGDEARDRQDTGSNVSNLSLVADLMIKCVCDPDGNLVFTRADAAEIELLDGTFIQDISEAITDFLGLSEEMAAAEKK